MKTNENKFHSRKKINITFRAWFTVNINICNFDEKETTEVTITKIIQGIQATRSEIKPSSVMIKC